jgi:hypothetical protein
MVHRNNKSGFSSLLLVFLASGLIVFLCSPTLNADSVFPQKIDTSPYYRGVDNSINPRIDTIIQNKGIIQKPSRTNTIISAQAKTFTESDLNPNITTQSSSSVFAGSLIIDHTCTNISKIPPYWLNMAKLLTFHYAHTSHGSQIITGLEYLEQQNPQYNVDITYGDTPPRLPDDESALRIYDGNNIPGGDTYISPDLYWEGESGIEYTRSVANTGLFDYSMWSWCGQASSYNEGSINQYLTTMNQLESQYPGMRFIYMTGHTDGGSAELAQNNNLIRNYVQNNNKILFDFNDIETYSPDGNGPYTNNDEGYCEWCDAWCTAHPEQCICFEDCMGDCAHTHQFFCKIKANAFWWMMARLAGWDGTEGAPVISSITPSSAPNSRSVTITNLAGNNFQTGARVNLTRTGYSNIVASNVVVTPPSKITCILPITQAATGLWNIAVKNPDGQTGTKTNSFTITTPASSPDTIGIFRNKTWYMDYNGNGYWDAGDKSAVFGIGDGKDIPINGDWNGDGKTNIGVMRGKTWYADYNGNGKWDAGDKSAVFGIGDGKDIPVNGDWNGDGKTNIGVVRGKTWYADYNGNGYWDAGDKSAVFGIGDGKDIPVNGDWNGDGKTNIGVMRGKTWYADYNGNGKWDAGDKSAIFGIGDGKDIPVTGDWNGDGKTNIGVVRGKTWYADYNGNGKWDAGDKSAIFGIGDGKDIPVTGKWP